MPLREGHTRPIGTTWRTRMRWHGDGDPELADHVYEVVDQTDDGSLLKRAFVVVGVEEPRRGSRWVVFLERIAWADLIDRLITAPDGRVWTFLRDRR